MVNNRRLEGEADSCNVLIIAGDLMNPPAFHIHEHTIIFK